MAMSGTRRRLDVWMVENGLIETRSRAQALIMAGKVTVNDKAESKSGRPITSDDTVKVIEGLPYVSRGGLKLAWALDHFSIDPDGWTVIDVGASTGGFTDCWLKRGAKQVFAVDVGYGQLDWGIRQDERVVVMERTNARYLTADTFVGPLPLEGASIDASFISLRLLLAPLAALLAPSSSLVALVKPQFEAGPSEVGKGGVVRHPEIHEKVLTNIVQKAGQLGYVSRGLTVSPLRGARGNIEFLLHLGIDPSLGRPVDIPEVVRAAWKAGERDE